MQRQLFAHVPQTTRISVNSSTLLGVRGSHKVASAGLRVLVVARIPAMPVHRGARPEVRVLTHLGHRPESYLAPLRTAIRSLAY